MGVFTPDEWLKIFEFASARLYKRDEFLQGVPLIVQNNRLKKKDIVAEQLKSDIFELNEVTQTVQGVLSIERWLRNAYYADPLDTEAQQFYRERADIALARMQPAPVAGSPRAGAAAAAEKLDGYIPQKVLWEGDLLPIGFITGALTTAKSVVRLAVTRFENGNAKTGATGNPVRYLGTGWLLGARHIITNHHVINARSPGETDASPSDFQKQARNCTIEFDYDDADLPAIPFACAALTAADKTLDFAVLELQPQNPPLNRAPLPLSTKPIVIGQNSYLPVNIIQHPGGQTKQIAIRNNLAARVDGIDLAYFTDTRSGSSGSPVCDDEWHVLALHKATTQYKGSFTYQGRDTAWINVGTPISLIVDHLKELQFEGKPVWDLISAPAESAKEAVTIGAEQ